MITQKLLIDHAVVERRVRRGATPEWISQPRADAGLPFEEHAGMDDRVGADRDVRLDVGRRGIDDA